MVVEVGGLLGLRLWFIKTWTVVISLKIDLTGQETKVVR